MSLSDIFYFSGFFSSNTMNLTSVEELFHDFVKKWNEKKLEDEIEI